MAENKKTGTRTMSITLPRLGETARHLIIALICVSCIVCIISLVFTPLYTYTSTKTMVLYPDTTFVEEKSDTLLPIDIFGDEDSLILHAKYISIALFVIIAVMSAIGGVMLFVAERKHAHSEARAYRDYRNLIFFADCVTGIYFLGGAVAAAISNYTTEDVLCEPNGGVQLWICVALTVLFAIVSRGIAYGEDENKLRSPSRGARVEFFIYSALIAALAIGAALGDILRVNFDIKILLEYNGFDALKGNAGLEGGLQLLTFLIVAILAVNASLFLLSLVSMIGRSRVFWQITAAEAVSGAVSTLLIGLFGKYYEIAQKINEELIYSWLREELEIQFGKFAADAIEFAKMNYEIESPSHWWFFAVLCVLALLLLRKPFSRGTKGELIIAGGSDYGSYLPEYYDGDTSETVTPAPGTGDPCPAFTEIDSKIVRYRTELEESKRSTFESPTLPALVDFVVNYARDSRLHLSYTHEDIAAFIAGLGTTRLTILQGMSGTGKTSLPKIFCEAIFGKCEIVEVESSWRDKNELLGYYNEFSRIYTPKKFTLALYRARLCPERTTFIVLDEMNLSRIEYYFSDFLSLMENEEEKREIKLIGTSIYPRTAGKTRYFGLAGGHTIRIPRNVWFIGTANRDESTFEISDKVYDRAHTMNFNKRAPKIHIFGEPREPRYLSPDELMRLFDTARESVYFDIDSSPLVAAVEELLAPNNITFGNRIANQIESFVRIYAACFGGTERAIADGLEMILLSKVVSKLEYKQVDNKAEIAAGFEQLGLFRCRDFVLRLNED